MPTNERDEMSNDTDWGMCDYRTPSKKNAHKAERGWRGGNVCWACWDWIKVTQPAALYWRRVSKDFLSQLDHNDLNKFLPMAIGVEREQVVDFVKTVNRLAEYCDTVLGTPAADTFKICDVVHWSVNDGTPFDHAAYRVLDVTAFHVVIQYVGKVKYVSSPRSIDFSGYVVDREGIDGDWRHVARPEALRTVTLKPEGPEKPLPTPPSVGIAPKPKKPRKVRV